MRPAYVPQLRLYQDWLREHRGLSFPDFESLRRWSVSDLDAFWRSIWDYDRFESPTPYTAVLEDERMPGARWFPGAQVNYAQRVFRHVGPAHAAGMPAIVSDNERGEARELSWPELRRQVASLALTLREAGVQRGDRVAAYLPNVPETVVAFLACASIGAVWSVCAPDMGTRAVLDRFRQIEPRVLIAADGIHYAGKAMDRAETVAALRAELPSVQTLVVLETPYASRRLPAELGFAEAIARDDAQTAAFEPEWLPFDHPLWIVYSSGTTGLPKPIVHGHGGIALMAAASAKHFDTGTSYSANNWGERFHWYSSTGWVMWNCQVNGLLDGVTICLFDGSPSGSKDAPDWGVLWRFAAKHRITYLGAGAAFYANCMKAGLDLSQCGDLRAVRALGSTGSPLSEEVQRWGTEQFERVGTPGIWWSNVSGGTDFCGAFIAGNRELPQTPGRMQCRQVGAAVEAWNEAGQPVIDEVGELVCTRPLPSMPLYLWGDRDHARYLSSYFDVYPGVWRHGDWLRILPDGSCIIYGRSDATINRHGLRMGTSEIYAAVEALPEVLDSMVIDLEYLGRPSRMILFVVMRPGHPLDAPMQARIRDAIRNALSPRFLPDDIIEAPEIPRTLSGKKQEVPIKKLFLGHELERVVNRDAMANPQCLAWYAQQAAAAATPRDTAK
ncbi:acetoacetate--CoA ligase [Caldimonas thermodepolymerans]|uniref:acetoacetate--CoA ligase n=1 Tax=Caldimonas thermodepolymerans TaxID=215580 RepID=UPI00223591BF|nr:acetoacetate--CoA ligase [Caldimonas thermodepolymerans]UZG42687.1 acetoacetate--CoA ligase [Caldimonas thermodepolymerans]